MDLAFKEQVIYYYLGNLFKSNKDKTIEIKTKKDMEKAIDNLQLMLFNFLINLLTILVMLVTFIAFFIWKEHFISYFLIILSTIPAFLLLSIFLSLTLPKWIATYKYNQLKKKIDNKPELKNILDLLNLNNLNDEKLDNKLVVFGKLRTTLFYEIVNYNPEQQSYILSALLKLEPQLQKLLQCYQLLQQHHNKEQELSTQSKQDFSQSTIDEINKKAKYEHTWLFLLFHFF